MRILMIGWEFPPFLSGGLGVHAYYITKHLSERDVEIVYIMPRKCEEISAPWLKILQIPVDGSIGPYMVGHNAPLGGDIYPNDPAEGARKYAESTVAAVQEYLNSTGEQFDLIHCHDWITFMAGAKLKEALGIPLVVTFHSTEYSRTADRACEQIVEIERDAAIRADRIIAVSYKFKQELVDRIGADPDKIDVIFNATDLEPFERRITYEIQKKRPIVLFLGRLTFQKGPEFFLRAAKLVSEIIPEARFVIAGSGFLQQSLIREAAVLGIADKVVFTGYVAGEQKLALYKHADVYVMPSVYEPFGITALEAMAAETAVIVSKNAGVTDLVNHVLTVEFWDVEGLANKIISVIKHRVLQRVLAKNGYSEVRKYTWGSAAELTKETYKRVLL